MSYGQANAAFTTAYPAPPAYNFSPESPSAFAGLAGRLSNQVSRVHDYVIRAQTIAHDVFGPVPTNATGAPTASPPSAPGHYASLSGWLDSLDFALTELGSHLDRLGGI